MPWHIEADNADCAGYAVVKDANGELEGCHRTRAQAERQLAALYAAEPEARAAGVPTQAMKDEAQRGLDWRAEHGRGGTAIGVARARDIVNGRTLSPSTIRRMRSFFARHEVDKQGQGFQQGEDGYPSAGRIAWALWGGDPGKAWADAQVAAMQARAAEAVVATDIDDTIVRNGTTPIQATIDKINSLGLPVYVITGRDPARRAVTVQLLNTIGLEYDDLIMVGSQAAKRDAILALAAEHPIAYAFENDPTVRGYYREAGANQISIRQMEGDMEENLTPRQNAQYEALEQIVEIFGQYDQGSKADGAHYVAASPFSAAGIVCANCAFYEGGRMCELVAGDIDPAGICKLWIINEQLIVEGRSRRAQVEEMLAQLRTTR